MTVVASLGGSAEAIWQAVVHRLPGFTVEVLPTIDSTNTELMRRARLGPLEPVLLVAEQQTAGRGRLGRGWYSRPGQSLTFSIGMRLAPAEWSGLSLAVGVSLAEHLHGDVHLKWPNDLWLHGRKLGGILVETAGQADQPQAPRSVVIGVGINVARPPDGSTQAAGPGALAAIPPAGMAEADVGVTPAELLERVVPALVDDVLRFEREGFGPFATRFAQRDALRDRTVTLSDGRSGTACGVAADGALRVMIAGAMQRIDSAEVSVRPC